MALQPVNICIIVYIILYKVNSCIYHTYLIVCYFLIISPNKSLLRHVRTVHQGMKRTDKKRKSDSHEELAVVNISTGEIREPGAVSRTFEA